MFIKKKAYNNVKIIFPIVINLFLFSMFLFNIYGITTHKENIYYTVVLILLLFTIVNIFFTKTLFSSNFLSEKKKKILSTISTLIPIGVNIIMLIVDVYYSSLYIVNILIVLEMVLVWEYYIVLIYKKYSFFDLFLESTGIIMNEDVYTFDTKYLISLLKFDSEDKVKQIMLSISNDLELNKIISYYNVEVEKNKLNENNVIDIIKKDYNYLISEKIEPTNTSDGLKERYESFVKN